MMRDAIDRFKAEEPKPGGERAQLPAPEKPQTINDLYDRNAMKSGRGFSTPDGQFKSRMEAKAWMKENEPDVHEMWLNEAGGDKQAELHSEAYAEARNRVQGRNLMQGDPVIDSLPPDLKRFMAEGRSTGGILNRIKAGLASKDFGFEAIRTLLDGPRKFFRSEGNQLIDRMRKSVPDKVEQQGLHFYRDYRGELPRLQADIEEIRTGDNEKLKAFLPAMEKAASWSGVLPKNISDADAAMTDYFTKQLDRGRALKTLDSGVDPSRYSPRMFMRAAADGEAPGLGRTSFPDKTVNSIRRDYLHTLDPLKEGTTEARTFNALDELSIYNDRMATANSTALFKQELKNSALGHEGTRAKTPANWVPLTKQFEDRRTIVQEDGSTVTTVKNLYVHPDIAKALKPLLRDPGEFSEIAKFLRISSRSSKAWNSACQRSISRRSTSWRSRTWGLGTGRAQWYRIIARSLFDGLESRFSLYGLETTKTSIPYESYKELNTGEKPTGLARLTDNKVTDATAKVAEVTSKYIFDGVQRKWKVMDMAKKEAGWVADHPDATESEYAKAMRGYAKEVNATYGGLNWDVMGVSKGMQSLSRLILLAPDWTFSNVANVKYALFGGGGTAGAASRAFFLKAAVAGFASTAAASYYIGGKYDPTDVKHLDQVYLGTDKDGKEMYANWFFAGAPKDLMNLMKRTVSNDPVTAVAEMMLSKASPVAGTVVDLAKNKDYKGAPIYKPDDTYGEKVVETSLYTGKKLLPITGVSALENVKQAITDPNYEWSYKDLLELAADVAGSQTMHQANPPKGRGHPKFHQEVPAARQGQESIQHQGAENETNY